MGETASITQLIEESQTLERSGDIADAVRRASLALDRARSDGEPAAIAAALNCAAFLQFRLGHFERARAMAEEGACQAPADALARADAFLLLGMCATETSDLRAGEDFYLRAIDLGRELGYPRALLRGLHNLAAGVYMPRGQFELALAANAEALRLSNEHAFRDHVWAILITTGWVYLLTGQRELALTTFEDLHRVALPGSNAEGYYCCAMANLALDDGDPTRVPSLLARARSIAEKTGEPSVNILVRLALCRHQRAVGDAGAARAWADDAQSLAIRVGYRHLQGMALIERARAAWQCGDKGAAEADLHVAIDLLGALGAAYDLARAQLFLAALLHEQKNSQAALTWKHAARAILQGNYAFLLEKERTLAFPLLAAHLNHPDVEIATLAGTLAGYLERIPPPPLLVLTLGRFEVRQGNRLISDHAWRQRRAGELFRLLLISPHHTLSRDQVIEALWENKSPMSSQALFHQATSTLRRALEPELPDKFPSRYVLIEEGQVALRLPPGSEVDWQVFEQHVQKEEWTAACAIYGGELFPGDRYADWAAAPRERFVRLYLRALLALARQALREGPPQAALDTCQRILEIDPWHENAVLIGMQACLGLDDRAGAIHLYRDLERTLREELGTSPQPALRKLYESLL